MGRFLRWLAIGFAVLFLLPLALLVWSLVHTESLPASTILHVTLDGPLLEAHHPSLAALLGGRSHMTLRGLTQGIRRAAEDDHIVGLVLDIRTPALGLAQLAEVADALADFRKSHKWNAAYLETAGELGHGDAAYALACGAEHIFLSPPGEINLSGLRSEVPFLKEAFERLHITPYTEQRYEFKNFANTFNQDHFTEEHLTALRTVLDDLQETLLESIAKGRQVNIAQAKAWVAGAPYSSEEAEKLRLVDHVAYWDEVRAAAEKVAGREDPFTDADTYVMRPQISRGHEVALIVAAGQISRGDTGKNPVEPTDGVGSDTLTQAFRDARHDEVKAVVLRVDSPGGSYVASDLIRREVELTRKAGIPVVVSMGNVAASGGYFIAIDADHIVVEPGSITGSIGVFAATFALRDFLHHWLGVNVGVYETLPHPGNLQWLDPPTPDDRARVGKTLDRIYRDFVTKVAAGRHKSYDEVHALAKGRIWSGRQAVHNGLADELGGIETAVAWLRTRLQLAADDPVRLVPYPESDSTLAMLRDLVTSRVQSEPWAAALAPWARWLTALVRGEETLLLTPWRGPS